MMHLRATSWKEPRDIVTGLALIYLVLPNVVFQIGYLRVSIAFVIAGSTVACLLTALRSVKSESASLPRSGSGLSHVVALAGPVGLWVLLSGAGGMAYQNPDWEKSNGILLDLVTREWPVAGCRSGSEIEPLVYYVGYYLPAAVVGRIAGWVAANVALYLWTCTGVLIAVALILEWMGLGRRPNPRLVVVLLAFFSGADIIGYVALWGLPRPGGHIDWWNAPWFQYPPLTSQLFWAPQHCVAAFVGGSLLLRHLEDGRGRRYLGLVAASLILTSPFGLVGLLPYLAMAVIRCRNYRELLDLASPENVGGIVAVGVPAVAFISASSFSFPIEWLFWRPGFVGAYSAGMLLEVVLLALVLFPVRPRVVSLAGITLALLPLIKLGQFNDLAMRGSIPSVWMLGALATRVLVAQHDEVVSTIRRRLLITVLSIGAVGPALEVSRTIGMYQFGRTWDTRLVSSVIEPDARSRELIRHQYVGRPDGLFFRTFTDLGEAAACEPTVR